jgi:hypothetical protein
MALDQILDIDTAIAERAAVLVRLGDLGRESHDAFESGNEILWDRSHGLILALPRKRLSTGR